MIGDGPDRPAAEALCREKGIAGLVHFLGNTPAVQEVMPAADLYVLTTDMESFGLSALEAQACGVPVLGYRAGGLPEVVESGTTGFLREVGDIDGLAADGIALLKDDEAWAAASRAARDARRLPVRRRRHRRPLPRHLRAGPGGTGGGRGGLMAAGGRKRRPKPGASDGGELGRRRPEAGQPPVLAEERRPEEAGVVGRRG